MDLPLHLLLPLASSVVFVVAATVARRAADLGANPYTITVASNGVLGGCWLAVGLVRGESLPLEAWGPAAGIAAAFVGGQLATYLAFRYGDVSLATPVFGVKIIVVAVLVALLTGEAIGTRVWIAAALATVGIGVLQAGDRGPNSKPVTARRALIAVGFALAAAVALSLFDVGVHICGRRYGAVAFLSTMFVLTGVISCGLIPWADRPGRLRERGALRPLTLAAVLMSIQAIGITFALAQFGDAARINIVYSLRGLWSVLLAWALSRTTALPESHSPRTLTYRLIGAALLTVAVLVALT